VPESTLQKEALSNSFMPPLQGEAFIQGDLPP
jgi:hypothetical protein